MLKEKISKYRTKVMKALEDDVKIPYPIVKDSEIRQNHFSKVLSELKAHDLLNVLILKLENVYCTD